MKKNESALHVTTRSELEIVLSGKSPMWDRVLASSVTHMVKLMRPRVCCTCRGAPRSLERHTEANRHSFASGMELSGWDRLRRETCFSFEIQLGLLYHKYVLPIQKMFAVLPRSSFWPLPVR